MILADSKPILGDSGGAMDFQAVLTANGYSQRKLAKLTGISQSEISRMYNGTKPWHPSILELMEEWTNEELTVTIPVCCDCGGAHHTQCHGKRGEVVILGDSEMIVDKPQPKAKLQTPKRAPVYRPVFSIEERERFDSLGGLRRIIDAGMAALGVTAETTAETEEK